VIVLVLLLACTYLALFLNWNWKPLDVVGWSLGGGDPYTQSMPVSLLVVVGILIGAAAMTVALWNSWNALKASETQQRELVQRAKAKLKAQDEKIKELTRKLEEQAAKAEAEPVELSPEAKAAAEDVEAAAGESKPAERAASKKETSEAKGGKAPEDDPEVI